MESREARLPLSGGKVRGFSHRLKNVYRTVGL